MTNSKNLIKALEEISNITAAASSSSDHDRLHKALDALDEARNIARNAILENIWLGRNISEKYPDKFIQILDESLPNY